MGFVLGFLGACLGIVAGIGIIAFVIYAKVRSVVGPVGMKEIKEAAKNMKDLKREEYTREKNVGGITKLIE